MKTLSKIASIFFLVMMLAGIVKNTVLCTLYDYNKSLFIELFCVNKNRPELKCDGQCAWAKMQQEQSDKEASSALKQLQMEVGVYTIAPIFSIDIQAPAETQSDKPCTSGHQLYTFLYMTRLVKPPALQG